MSGTWPGRLALVVTLGMLGGPAGLLVGVAVAVYDAVRSPPPRELLLASVVLLAAVPLAVLGPPAQAAAVDAHLAQRPAPVAFGDNDRAGNGSCSGPDVIGRNGQAAGLGGMSVRRRTFGCFWHQGASLRGNRIGLFRSSRLL